MSARFLRSHRNEGYLAIRKDTAEWAAIIILTVFSFFNSITLLISLLILLLFLLQKEVGALKILNLVTFRTIINPGIGIGIEHWQFLKWAIIILCSLYLLKSYFILTRQQQRKINSVLVPVLLFAAFNTAASLLVASLPLLAVARVWSYVVPFLAVLIGIIHTGANFDWLIWSYKLFSGLMLVSLPMFFTMAGFLRNGWAFQGLTNHPNMFGIITALFLGLLLSATQMGKGITTFSFWGMLLLSLTMVGLSASRTAFVAAAILLVVFLFYANITRILKIAGGVLLTVVLTSYLFLDGGFFVDFLLKGQEDLGMILFSRQDQIATQISNFTRSPWVGSGFAIPVTPDVSFAFAMDTVVEPGNVILAMLSYGGIIGFLLFALYMVKILQQGRANYRNTIFMPLAAVLISMGEMVFFSTNNIGIWLYMLIGIYAFGPAEVHQKKTTIQRT